MKLFISLSKQRSDLYHYTERNSLLKMLKSNKLELSVGTMIEEDHQNNKLFFVSLTRSRYGSYHMGKTGIMITFDGQKLAQNHKIIPVDYWNKMGDRATRTGTNNEKEERLVSDKPYINNILKFIKKIDIIQKGSILQETYGMDTLKGKYELSKYHDERRESSGLSSIILLLKKNKIPYSFYDNMKDWSLNKGAYTPTFKFSPSVPGPSKYGPSRYEYNDLTAILNALTVPYEKMNKRAKEISKQLWHYPKDIDSVMNAFFNARKAGTEEPTRSLVVKVAKTLKYLKLLTKEQIQQHIGKKAGDYLTMEGVKNRLKLYTAIAEYALEAHTNDEKDWKHQVNVYIKSTKELFDISERFSYQFDSAVREIQNVVNVTNNYPKLITKPMLDLTKLIETHFDDVGAFVAKIYYKKVRDQ